MSYREDRLLLRQAVAEAVEHCFMAELSVCAENDKATRAHLRRTMEITGSTVPPTDNAPRISRKRAAVGAILIAAALVSACLTVYAVRQGRNEMPQGYVKPPATWEEIEDSISSAAFGGMYWSEVESNYIVCVTPKIDESDRADLLKKGFVVKDVDVSYAELSRAKDAIMLSWREYGVGTAICNVMTNTLEVYLYGNNKKEVEDFLARYIDLDYVHIEMEVTIRT